MRVKYARHIDTGQIVYSRQKAAEFGMNLGTVPSKKSVAKNSGLGVYLSASSIAADFAFCGRVCTLRKVAFSGRQAAVWWWW